MSKLKSVCVYCGSQGGNNRDYLNSAVVLGTALAKAKLRLVYGGGAKGIMGAVADAVLAGRGEVTGIIPQFLITKEASAPTLARLSQTIITQNMHERKHAMFERADAFVALPGGIGTLEEIIEVMTWAQLGRHKKPILLANINGFWDRLVGLIDHMHEEGFIHSKSLVRPLVVEQPEAIVPALLQAAKNAANGGDASAIGKL